MAKIWFITGASRGFGREWAEAALERGDTVAATARNLGTLDPLVERYGDAILPLQLDVTNRSTAFSKRTFSGRCGSHRRRCPSCARRGQDTSFR